MKSLNMKHLLTTTYCQVHICNHSVLCNGLDERFNHTLQNMIRKYVHENKKNWDNFLDALSYTYNTYCHESTLHPLFEVMFVRKAILPIDLDVKRQMQLNYSKISKELRQANH